MSLPGYLAKEADLPWIGILMHRVKHARIQKPKRRELPITDEPSNPLLEQALRKYQTNTYSVMSSSSIRYKGVIFVGGTVTIVQRGWHSKDTIAYISHLRALEAGIRASPCFATP